MKKIIQNILAQNSKNEITYLCGKCGKEIDKEAVVCNHCGAKLGKIRCPFCNYVGTLNDFKFDTCPRCGRKKKSDLEEKKLNKKSSNKTAISKNLFWLLFILLISIIIFIAAIFLYNFDIL